MDSDAEFQDHLAAGVILIPLTPPVPRDLPAGKTSADGWTTLSLDSLDSFAQILAYAADTDSSTGFLEALRFLVKHLFLGVAWRSLDAESLALRIFVVPYDLPKFSTKLRARSEAILRKGREFLRPLLLRVVQSGALWNGVVAHPAGEPSFLDQSPDDRTLLEIYNSLPSPTAELQSSNIPGLRSSLYPYQKQTVAEMIRRETARQSPHPLFVSVKGVDGKIFYLQPTSMEVYTDCPGILPPKGGILCEELGTGKTVMVLALVLATVDQLPQPEESIYEERPVNTFLSLHHFQTAPALAAQQKLGLGSDRSGSPSLPSLVEILLHRCRTSPNGLNLRGQQDHLAKRSLWHPLLVNAPFYLHSPDDNDSRALRRQQASSRPKVMFLTTATLIIVPGNLLAQWRNEVLKHCTDMLRVLVVQSSSEKLPDARKLASNYDIVLLSHLRYSQEAKKMDLAAQYSWKGCTCPPMRGSRVPYCRCTRYKTVSPLLQIRWKRLMVDEGHTASIKGTNYAALSKQLSVERRWIVTGTPTTNLIGIKFGGTDLQYPEEDEELPTQQRIWRPDERSDFMKLGTIISDFLMLMPFSENAKAFNAQVTHPIFSRTGPYPGDIQVLSQVMSTVMLRHQIEDVEKDVLLPMLHHETVLLDMDPMAIKTYNLIQASIAVNAVDSERRDQDYMFHPMNVKALQETMGNVAQSMFWHVWSREAGLDELLRNAEGCLQDLHTGRKRGRPEDFELIRQAIPHITCAMNDPVWQALQSHYNIFHHVNGLPEDIHAAWSPFPASRHPRPSLLHPTALMSIRALVTRSPLSPAERLVHAGTTFVSEERKRLALFEHATRHQRGKAKQVPGAAATKAQFESVGGGGDGERARKEEKLKDVEKELNAAAERMAAAFEGDVERGPPTHPPPQGRPVASTLLRLSPVAKVRVGNSTSTKLDYILNDVLTYSAKEKFLIFSTSPSTLAFIAEALELVQVKYLEYSGKLTAQYRASFVTTFETSDLYRVMLMELKHGARGLNLVSASRVIFCEPVWKADVESQAIKRVHRIGQTRFVSIKTLAIRSTSEEVIVARREALKEGNQESANDPTDDRTIRDFIEYPTFLPLPTERLVKLDVPLFELGDFHSPVNGNSSAPVEVVARNGRPGRIIVPGGQRRVAPVVQGEKEIPVQLPPPPPKKRRTVLRFE